MTFHQKLTAFCRFYGYKERVLPQDWLCQFLEWAANVNTNRERPTASEKRRELAAKKAREAWAERRRNASA